MTSQTRRFYRSVGAWPGRDPEPWLIASNNSWSRKGFVKNSTAPDFMALTVMGISPWPVIRMMGLECSPCPAPAEIQSR